jgi:hypothetical protein
MTVDNDERQAHLGTDGFNAARGMPTLPRFSLQDRWRADRPPEISYRNRTRFSFSHWILGQRRPKTWLINCNKTKTFKGNIHVYLDSNSLNCVAWQDLCNFFFYFLSMISRYRNFICNTRMWIDVHNVFFIGNGSKNCFYVCPSIRPYNFIALSNIIKNTAK